MSLFPISVRKLIFFFLTSISYSIFSKIWTHHSAYITSFSSVVLCLLFVHLLLLFLLLFNPRKFWHCLNHQFLKISISSKCSMLLPFAERNLILSTFSFRLLKRTKGDRAGWCTCTMEQNAPCQSRWCTSPCGTPPPLKHSTPQTAGIPQTLKRDPQSHNNHNAKCTTKCNIPKSCINFILHRPQIQ